jgi:hypothetical protein
MPFTNWVACQLLIPLGQAQRKSAASTKPPALWLGRRVIWLLFEDNHMLAR